jgi:hypothetical protein
MHSRGKMFDALLEMHGTGVVAAAAAATAVDLGLGAPMTGGPPYQVGYTEGKLILDITAVSTLASEDQFEIQLQCSHDATFTTWHTLFATHLGWQYCSVADRMGNDPSAVRRSSMATWPGPVALPVRMTLPFCNDFAGVTYRWLRVVSMMTTPTTGINYYAFLTI